MRILLTNDDGIESEGLLSLRNRLLKDHEVWIVAPEKEQSASSHAISIFRPVRVCECGERIFKIDGTPADCVLLGIRTLIVSPVDAVISGINRGPNLGTDILYSGTVAAARQGALLGKPSFAFSLSPDHGRFSFEQPAEFAVRLFHQFYPVWVNGHFLNINFPSSALLPYVSAVTFPSLRNYRDHYETFRAPDKSLYCFLSGDGADSKEEDGCDFCAIQQGKVSISPLAVHPANHEKESFYRKIIEEKDHEGP
jgi:5'-nucleotidase